MDKQQTTPIAIPNSGNQHFIEPCYTKDQHSSCLTKLYGMSPDMKVSHDTYIKWCREQQDIIDNFISNRPATESI